MFNKKGVVGQMVGLAIGIVILAVIATIGVVVVAQMGNAQGAGLANNSADYAAKLLGNGTGGLLTWLPVIIPAVIGIAIIGYFMMLSGGKKGY